MLLELPIMLLSIIPKTSLLCLKLCSGILSDNVKFNRLKIHVGFLHSSSSDIHYIMTPTMYFVEFITLNHCIHHIPKNYCRFTQIFSSHFQNSCLCSMSYTNSLPIMLALYARCFYHPIMLQIMLA